MHIRESSSRALTLLTKNPALFGRVLVTKANAARSLAASPLRCRFGDVLFELDAANNPAAAAMYRGAYSPLIVNAMKRCLHPGDVFLDVGANIGYLSAVGAGLVGANGQVHSFEPVPRYFQNLRRLAELNPAYSIVVNQCAAGAVSGTATILVTREPGQNTLVPGYKRGLEVQSTLDVPLIRLDSYIEKWNIARVALIKIDTEGFELPVLDGLQGLFERGQRPAIVCEIAPRAYPLIGRTVGDLEKWMSLYGYKARDIIDGRTQVTLTVLKHVTDVLFLADN
jgi:FkbM family methyltransferase